MATYTDDSLVAAVRSAVTGARTAVEACDAFCDGLRGHAGRHVLVAVYALDGERLQLVAQRGYTHAINSLGIGEGIIGVAVRDGEPVHAPDPAQHPAYVVCDRRVHESLSVPFDAGDVQGGVVVESTGARLAPTMTTAVAELAAAIGRVAGDSFVTDGGIASLKRAFVRIGAQRDPLTLLDLTAQTVGALLDAEFLRIAVHRDGGWRSATTWVGRHGAGASISNGELTALAERPGERDGSALHVDATGTIALPLRVGSDLIAYLVAVGSPIAGPELGERVLQAELVCAHSGPVLYALRTQEALRREAATDALTGLWNHRRFGEDAARLGDQRFGLVLCDLDDFKTLNDHHGHVAGDAALRTVGATLRAALRADDSAYRLGGEEFALLLPGAGYDEARAICERLREALAVRHDRSGPLTASFGIAENPRDGATLLSLVDAADAALYESKRLGKNRVTVAGARQEEPGAPVPNRRRFDQIRLLHRLGERLVGAASARETAEAVADSLAERVPHDGVRVVLIDGPLRLPTLSRGIDGVGFDAIAGRALARDEPVIERGWDGGRGSAIAAVLGGGHEPRAIIVLARRGDDPFDREDGRLLRIVGRFAALSLRNAELLGLARAEADTATTLLELVARLAVSTTPHEVAQAVAELALEHVPSDTVTVWTADSRELVSLSSEDVVGSPDERSPRSTGAAGPPSPAGAERARDGAHVVQVPVLDDDHLLGTVSMVRDGRGYAPREVELLQAIAAQAALAIRACTARDDAEQSFIATVEALLEALAATDEATSTHARQLEHLAVETGVALGFEGDSLSLLGHAAVLHDIGKIAIPPEVLRKPGPLDPTELALMRTHPDLGARILAPVHRLSPVIPMVRHSHERVDGRGYPDGLAGDAIPLGARIVAVVDAFHAMTSDRPYRRALGIDEAIAELRRCAGTQFDADVVRAFLHVVATFRGGRPVAVAG